MRQRFAANPYVPRYEFRHSLPIMVEEVGGHGRCAQVLQLETGTAIAERAYDFCDFMIDLAGPNRRLVAYRRGAPSVQSLLMTAAMPGPHT